MAEPEVMHCIHVVNNDGECGACGQTLRLMEFRLLMQPIYVDDRWPERRYAPIRMPAMHVPPETLHDLIQDPESAGEVLRRLRDVKEGEDA